MEDEMNAGIKITHLDEMVSVDIEEGTGTFQLVLNETPTDEWRKLFDKVHSKDYPTALKATEHPARIEVTCQPGDVKEATEVVKSAIERSNAKLDDHLKKAERKAIERAKAITELQETMKRELATLKFD
jgi:hypothetical protein